ncbi:FadR family transcriptional regulator [Stakelama sp. CBK3Z-3]|uniref:FadR family transcriptional regulator n=1 Tax=Stakelama flava TaxID=2860338 RepID=A0ABS6XPF9_9SPHN|nr:FadR/GntR family transcriptional regulator [Stakelama flava]MBW4332016.1 FadR family transcriptional regulator [Stakelama flava]
MQNSDNGRLYERVARDLGAKISEGAYPIGSRLPAERNLAQSYGVSRPTIREAIIALELDGLVEVRMGSGVYVVATEPEGGEQSQADVGPFELIEARRAIEGEACAIAAPRIDKAALAELDALVDRMQSAVGDIPAQETADRQFHMTIAQATNNSAIYNAVETLWDARARSPQYRLLSDKAHSAGVGPIIDEHAAIVEALRSGDAAEARRAMVSHLSRVLESLLHATEVQEIEQARARVAAQRQQFSLK